MKSTSPTSSVVGKNAGAPYKYPTVKSAMRASRGSFLAAGFFSFFINLLMLTGPLFMLQIYDRVLASRSLPTLFVLFLLVAGLFAFLGFLEFIRARILSRIGANIFQRVHERIFDVVMHVSLRTGGASNSTKPLSDLSQLQQYISGPGPASFFDAPWVPIYLLVIFAFHQWLGILALVATLILFVIALMNDFRARKPNAMAAQAASAGTQIADAGRRNAEVLKAMGMLGAIRARWQDNQLNALAYQTSARDRAGTLTAFSKSLRLFLQSAMLALGALLTIQQEITPGTMIAASIILGRALQPVEQAIAHWRGFIQARQAYYSLDNLLGKVANNTKKTPLDAPKGRIEAKGLAVAAPNSRKILLRNINFSIEPGRLLAIVGQSGGGKSTLLRTLAGVLPAVGGEVRIDEATHDQWAPDQLGRHLGYLPQDVELFGGKINENIARFQPDFDEQDIFRAAKLAGVDKLIKHLGGYDADIGPMGTSLSAGQRQRIALARAMYLDPAIILLDEPNSNLDEIGDQALLQALLAMRKNGQTVVIATHRMNILKISDYVLELTEGNQSDFGPTREVVPRIIEKTRQNAQNALKKSASIDVKQAANQSVPPRPSGATQIPAPLQPKGETAPGPIKGITS